VETFHEPKPVGKKSRLNEQTRKKTRRSDCLRGRKHRSNLYPAELKLKKRARAGPLNRTAKKVMHGRLIKRGGKISRKSPGNPKEGGALFKKPTTWERGGMENKEVWVEGRPKGVLREKCARGQKGRTSGPTKTGKDSSSAAKPKKINLGGGEKMCCGNLEQGNGSLSILRGGAALRVDPGPKLKIASPRKTASFQGNASSPVAP